MKRVDKFHPNQICQVCSKDDPGFILEIPLRTDAHKDFRPTVRVHQHCINVVMYDMGGVRYLHQELPCES